ncbi:MAG: iron ABC transporter permease [Planctomycetota bacterium]|nr:MAG: iron ABC transporter permease [Planctomycetota bacterium]
MRYPLWAVWCILLLALVAVITAALGLGVGSLRDSEHSGIFLQLRSWRVIAAAVVGAGLGVAGVLLQGLFRNPLADPGIIGTSAGATLGGMLVVIAAQPLAQALRLPVHLLVPLGCMGGALLSLWFIVAVARYCRDSTTVLLAGVVLSMLFASIGVGLSAMFAGYWEISRALSAFALGGLDGKGLEHVLLAVPLVVAAWGAGWWWWARPLDVVLAGEDEAQSLGVDLQQLRRWVIIWSTLAIAGAVAIAGNIAFVGLIVPHILRSLVGANHRRLLPTAAVGGMVFVIACDVVVRLVPGGTSIPLGVMTGLIGAPLFVVLLLRQRRGMMP